MKKRVLALALAVVLLAGVMALPVHSANAASTTATVKGGWLRLRALPNFDATTLASYYTGTVMTVLGTVGDWYHVTAPDGYSGYMYGKYLNVSGSSSSGGYQNISATVVSSNGLGVRMRTGPGTAYGVLGLYPVGTRVTILKMGGSWHYIRIGNTTGYMMSQYLSTNGGTVVTPPATSGGYTAYVTSENGLGVRLRKGPGTGYGVYGLYSVGTRVSVLEHGSTWDYVRIGSRTGYMMTKYLTTSYTPTPSNDVITSVSLNTSSPVPGTTLYASIRPSGASVYYEWLNGGGVLLSSASTYTVKSDDVGQSIRVRVTGTGHYSGTAVSGWAKVKSAGSSSTTKVALTGVSLSNLSPSIGDTVTANAKPSGATANYVWYRDDGTNLGSGQNYTVKASDAGHAIYCAAYATGNYTGNVASYYTGKISAPVQEDKPISGMVMLPASANQGANLEAGINVNCDDYTITWRSGNRVYGTGYLMTVTQDMAGRTLTCVVTANEGSGYTGSITSNECHIPPLSEDDSYQGG